MFCLSLDALTVSEALVNTIRILEMFSAPLVPGLVRGLWCTGVWCAVGVCVVWVGCPGVPRVPRGAHEAWTQAQYYKLQALQLFPPGAGSHHEYEWGRATERERNHPAGMERPGTQQELRQKTRAFTRDGVLRQRRGLRSVSSHPKGMDNRRRLNHPPKDWTTSRCLDAHPVD